MVHDDGSVSIKLSSGAVSIVGKISAADFFFIARIADAEAASISRHDLRLDLYPAEKDAAA